jgi:AraC family transcriptional regulator
MTAGTSHGHPLTGAFRQEETGPAVRTLRKSALAVTEILSRAAGPVTGRVANDDAYVVTLHLRPRPPGIIVAEGRRIRAENFRAGNAGIVDLRMQLVSEYGGPFHYISFYLKRQALDAFVADAGAPRIGDLRHRPGIGFADPVVRHLLLSIRPSLERTSLERNEPPALTTVFVDHVAMALVSHMASAYGGMQAPRLPEGGLTSWQERRAKELLDAGLDGAVTLAELAGACKLSARHFARAFRRSTGQSPHKWLVERRLEKATGLLELSPLSLREIAAACGFSSQSHFARAFRQATGTSPGAWRRGHRP